MFGCLSHACSTLGDLTHNPGMCPEWESNWRPFGLEAGTQSTELHQPGLFQPFVHPFNKHTVDHLLLARHCAGGRRAGYKVPLAWSAHLDDLAPCDQVRSSPSSLSVLFAGKAPSFATATCVLG